MIRVRLRAALYVGGGAPIPDGEVVDISDDVAAEMIAAGTAEPVEVEAPE